MSTRALVWLKYLGLLLCLLLTLVVVVNWSLVRAVIGQRHMFLPPDFDHTPPEFSRVGEQKHLLIFSKTNGYRHHDAIPAARRMFEQIVATNRWFMFATENAAIFNAQSLSQFDVVVLNSSSGTLYTPEQQAALQNFLQLGGGLVALHAAGGDTSYEWDWYADTLIRARFVDHPMRQHIQSARLVVEQPEHPVVEHLGTEWRRADEWYNFQASPREHTSVLLSIDESSYDPEGSPMGGDHPLVWTHDIGSGRVLYSALGHIPETYREPAYVTLITEAIRWVDDE